MTEYEPADYIASMMSNFLSALTIYFSIATAYVVAVFMAGTRLTGIQLAIVNLCFVVAAGIMGTLSVPIFDRFFAFASQVTSRGSSVEPVNFTLPLSILVAGVFVGCVAFMWSTRRGGDA